MKYSLNTQQLQLSAQDKKLLDKKLSRLEKRLKVPYTSDIVVKKSRHHNKGDVITCRINIKQPDKSLYAERTTETIQDSIDTVINAISKEIRKGKTRSEKMRRLIKKVFRR